MKCRRKSATSRCCCTPATAVGEHWGLNILCALASLLGAAGAVLLVGILPNILPYALALASSSFLYVAMSDLIPDLHSSTPGGLAAVRQVILVGLGMTMVLLL